MKLKRNTLKASICLFLAICMCAASMPAFCPTPAWAQDSATQDAQTQAQTATSTQKTTSDLGFVFIDKKQLAPTDTQNIAICLNDESTTVQAASLTIKNAYTNQKIELTASAISGESALFTFTPSEKQLGKYTLTQLSYTTQNDTQTTNQIDLGDQNYTFEVCDPSQTNSTANGDTSTNSTSNTDLSSDITIYTQNTDGTLSQSPTIADALNQNTESKKLHRNNTSATATPNDKQTTSATANTTSDYYSTVVLDPGHGGSDSGAIGLGGEHESDINLAIAKSCKDKLDAYSGVSAFLTRADDSDVTLADRVALATTVHADIFVSIHCNSADSATATGFEIYYPNDSSFNPECHSKGYDAASAIQKKLDALGLYDRGLKTGTYHDTTKDYYYVIRECREQNIPGMIVEHAFMSTEKDIAMLRDPEFQKQLGQSDATGVADYLGLKDMATARSKGKLQLVAHVENVGYTKPAFDEQIAGTSSKNLHMWFFNANLINSASSMGSIKYRSYAGGGWRDWVSNGTNSGNMGTHGASVNAIQMQLVGNIHDTYDILYRVYLRESGWTDWVRNGSSAGKANRTVEAIEAKLVPSTTRENVTYRLYNEYSGEHLYTTSSNERDNLLFYGWRYEGIGWYVPKKSNTPVYRLYNPYTGDHLYTIATKEKKALVRAGWRYEKVAFYSDDDKTVRVLRQFNPNATIGTHNYTTSSKENDALVGAGWHADSTSSIYATKAATPDNRANIMGTSTASPIQMVKFYTQMGKTYPAGVYASKGAATINQFAQICFEEAEAEGVRAEVVFCQAMHETGWLQFGGDVKPEQCNFAGLGATGGVPGYTFANVREGLRAQVQHLKAYASTDALKNPCVDPRFNLVQPRGKAPRIVDLSGKWAVPGIGYGENIYSLIQQLIKF